LYAKGVDQLFFEYAVFLLNKDIEQVMNAVGLPIKNLKMTLSNIQSISNRLTQLERYF
jgi:hypothetical protein